MIRAFCFYKRLAKFTQSMFDGLCWRLQFVWIPFSRNFISPTKCQFVRDSMIDLSFGESNFDNRSCHTRGFQNLVDRITHHGILD